MGVVRQKPDTDQFLIKSHYLQAFSLPGPPNLMKDSQPKMDFSMSWC